MLLSAPLFLAGSSNVLRAQGDFKGARLPTTSPHIRTRHPNSGVAKADIAIIRGSREYEAGNLDAAEKFYKQALTSAPNSLDAHLGLGDVESARYEKSETDDGKQAALQRGISHYRRAVEIDPTSNDAVRGLALLLWKSPLPSTVAQAEPYLKKLTEMVPNEPVYHMDLGYYYYRVQFAWEKGMAEYRIAEKLTNDREYLGQIYDNMTNILPYLVNSRLDPKNEILQVALKWVRVQPESADAHRILGYQYYYRRRYPEAIHELEQAVRLKPEKLTKYSLSDVYRDVAREKLKAHDKAGAMEEYRKIVALGLPDVAAALLEEINKQ